MSQSIAVRVPNIGEFKEVPVIEVLVEVGDTVDKEQSLVTLESDKATIDVPSSEAGVVKEMKVKVGDNVSEGTLIMILESGAGKAKAEEAPKTAVVPAATPTAAATGGTVEVKVPDIGDFKDIPVIEIGVKVGEKVEKEQSLVTLESDKATMDVPSPVAGVVKEINVTLGDNVSEGTLIVLLESGKSVAPTAAAPKAEAVKVETHKTAALAQAEAKPAEDGRARHASPSVRKFARELAVDVGGLAGSGPKGRITKEDIIAFVKGVMSGQCAGPAAASAPATVGGELNLLPWPKIDFTKFGVIEAQPLSRIKKISGANLHRNWVMIPHVTHNDEADITELETLRIQLNKENEKSGIKFTMLAFVIKAVVSALKQFPTFNASLDGDNLILKQHYHIGFAADTPNGLVVPVIRDADKKGLAEIAKAMADLSNVAREGTLKLDQMQGGCFSISSLGGIGGTHFTPIVNAPEVAILGLSRGAMKPVWDGTQFVPRLMLPMSLSYDHRVIDGAAAARFNAYLAQILGDFRRVIL
ncbi:MAG: dihydrolipoyllysine-residue acetyltransferase [Burkholderia sp.]